MINIQTRRVGFCPVVPQLCENCCDIISPWGLVSKHLHQLHKQLYDRQYSLVQADGGSLPRSIKKLLRSTAIRFKSWARSLGGTGQSELMGLPRGKVGHESLFSKWFCMDKSLEWWTLNTHYIVTFLKSKFIS